MLITCWFFRDELSRVIEFLESFAEMKPHESWVL